MENFVLSANKFNIYNMADNWIILFVILVDSISEGTKNKVCVFKMGHSLNEQKSCSPQ